MSHEKSDGGPYREAADPNALSLKSMKKKIEAEGKNGIPLPENVMVGNEINEFVKLLKKVEPKKISFYSLATGILQFTNQETDSPNTQSFYYNNPNNKSVELNILLDKKGNQLATVFSLTTKAKVENDKKISQGMKKEADNKK